MGADRSPELESSPEGAVYCARHPQVETYLRCGNCGTPICPRCLVQTPVGAKCRDCARVTRLPTFDVTPVYFARGMTAALVSGIVTGGVWAFLAGLGFGLFFLFFIGLGVGWAISESVSVATNRKRGLGLQVCAVLGVVLAYLVYLALFETAGVRGGAGIGLLGAGIAAFFAAARLKMGA